MALLTVKPFTKAEWDMYAGCGTQDPYFAEITTEVGIANVVFDEDVQIHYIDEEADVIAFKVNNSAMHVLHNLSNEMTHKDLMEFCNAPQCEQLDNP